MLQDNITIPLAVASISLSILVELCFIRSEKWW
jgi:hypothetical protein